ncbi:hypothetical protein IZ6_26830 [Terrihabitans soli]|uniref:DUF1648 domain-containing protein n=1 Tax=Terrihabitans soli TaxID=708113 RepID=A0A6S6QZ90_9HYPH|nr:DUF1648 domain-containing protein [Terrihabitans soli]BCJ91948.1 hypothetical protein IZ6_26830 [Terrihabitans soli]
MTYLPFIILAAMLLIAFAAALRMKAARIPMQWDFKGHPTWYAPRFVAFGFPVFVGLFVLALVAIALPAEAPHWVRLAAVGGVFFGQLLHLFLLNRWQKKRAR